jgi:SHS2 domain-containing protein
VKSVEKTLAGFSEIEHTADWELAVWAPDLPALLEQAARGMYALSGIRLLSGPRQRRDLTLTFADPEGLLVSFLSELLWLGERDSLGFDVFGLELGSEQMHAHLEGAPIAARSKEIKAVTFHNLVVRRTARGLEVNLVFDV